MTNIWKTVQLSVIESHVEMRKQIEQKIISGIFHICIDF